MLRRRGEVGERGARRVRGRGPVRHGGTARRSRDEGDWRLTKENPDDSEGSADAETVDEVVLEEVAEGDTVADLLVLLVEGGGRTSGRGECGRRGLWLADCGDLIGLLVPPINTTGIFVPNS